MSIIYLEFVKNKGYLQYFFNISSGFKVWPGGDINDLLRAATVRLRPPCPVETELPAKQICRRYRSIGGTRAAFRKKGLPRWRQSSRYNLITYAYIRCTYRG